MNRNIRRLLIAVLLLFILAAAAVLYVFDDKDNCLDYGGHYDEYTKTCVKP